MELEFMEMINGIFSIALVSISVFLGLKIMAKYFKFKDKNFMFVGLAWIGMVQAWYSSVLSFLLIILMNQSISCEMYLLVGVSCYPLTILSWLYVFTELVYKIRQKTILTAFTLIGALFYICFLYYIFTDVSIICELYRNPIEARYKSFVFIYLSAMIIMVALITGILFSRVSLRSDNPQIRLKGKFLLAAFISFVIGSILDTSVGTNTIALLIARGIVLSSSFEFYFGFILPEKVKKLFLHDQ